MNINEILSATNGKLYNKINLNDTYSKIKINSRLIEKDDIFIAIIGEKFDGHDFIKEAISKKAKLIISEKKLDIKHPYILVDSTIKAMGDIAKYMIEKYKPNVIAITGSMGKTTTRNIIYNLLKTKYNVLTNEKNYNNNIGVPLTIFNLNEKTDILLLELGMNHLKELSYLSKMIKPNASVITNIGTSHIGYLKSKENILNAKLEILDGMKEKVLFINGDDEYLKNIMDIKLIKSGFNQDNDLIGYNLKTNLYHSTFNIKYNNKEYEIKVNLPKHLLNNVLNSISVAIHYKIDIETIIETLRNYKTYNQRMTIQKDKNGNTIINDCYNNSFESLTGVLEVLQNENGRKLLILGDIKELGMKSQEIHQNIKKYLDKIENKELILVGEEMQNVKTNALYFNDYKETINHLKTQKIKDTLILIKASHSLKFNNIVSHFINY